MLKNIKFHLIVAIAESSIKWKIL